MDAEVPGGGQQRQPRPPETLSPQQLREWAVRWGSPGGGAWGTSAGSVEAPVLVPVTLADPSGSPVLARGSTVLPCPAAPSGSLTGLHLPLFARNLVATAVLQDQLVTVTQPGGELVAICTDSRTSKHLATFTRRPGSGLYTLTTASVQVAESGTIAASGEVSASLPPLPRSLAPPCLPCVQGQHRAAPHSTSFSPTTAPLQTLYMDVWGPAHVTGQGGEHYFLLIVDDNTRYTMVVPLQSKVDVRGVLIHWICAVRRQLSTQFHQDLPVLWLYSDQGGEFSFHLLKNFSGAEGITQSFTLLASPQQNGIAECRIGLVMEVARTSLVYSAAPDFLWPFTVRYAAHQLNLWPCVSNPETSHTLRWTGEVGDASAFRGPAHSGVSQVDPPPLVAPLEVSSDTFGPAEGGDPAADDTVATCRSPRLATPPGFPPRLSSPPLPPVTVDSGAERGGDTGGADSGGAGSGGGESPTGGRVMGTTAGDSGSGPWGAGTGGAGTGGAGTGGASAGGAGAGGTGAGGAGVGGAGGAGAGGAGAGGAGTVAAGGAGSGGAGARGVKMI
ncbi:unnamed protein product [Closterium sp. NIES-54]